MINVAIIADNINDYNLYVKQFIDRRKCKCYCLTNPNMYLYGVGLDKIIDIRHYTMNLMSRINNVDNFTYKIGGYEFEIRRKQNEKF